MTVEAIGMGVFGWIIGSIMYQLTMLVIERRRGSSMTNDESSHIVCHSLNEGRAINSEYGRIICHSKLGPLDTISYDYEWEGGKKARLDGYTSRQIVGYRWPETGDVFSLGGLRLRVVEADPTGLCYVMRDGWRAWLTAKWWSIGRYLSWLGCRLILTAHVWGLASYDPATIPHWRDVYALRWLERKLKR